MYDNLGDSPKKGSNTLLHTHTCTAALPDGHNYVDVIVKLYSGEISEDLNRLLSTPDYITPHPDQCFHSALREKLQIFKNNPVLALLENSTDIQNRCKDVEAEDTPQVKILILIYYS